MINSKWSQVKTKRAPAAPFVRLLVVVGAVLPVFSIPPLVQAQDDFDLAKKPAVHQEQNNRFGIPDFDQWVLGGRNRDQIEHMLKSQLTLHIESANRACELSTAQREKLQLAGEGDMKRLNNLIEQARQEFREVGQDQQKLQNCYAQASLLQGKLRTGVFDESSLYQKVLRQTLNKEQSLRYEQQELERRKFRYEAKIEMVLSNLENRIVLRAEQRQQLVKLMLDETEPPKKFGDYDYYMVIYQMAKLKDDKLKVVVDDDQLQSLKKVFRQYGGMEQYLRSQGYLQ